MSVFAKTKTLPIQALNWVVAKAEYDELAAAAILHPEHAKHYPKIDPCSDWSQGGPIIEREQIDLKWVGANTCRASIDWLDEECYEAFGTTPLVAAMRCFAVKCFGLEVEVPQSLLAGLDKPTSGSPTL